MKDDEDDGMSTLAVSPDCVKIAWVLDGGGEVGMLLSDYYANRKSML